MDEKTTDKLIREPVPKLLFVTCSQTIMSVMLYSIYSLVDTFFVARGAGAYAAGAVALSGPVVQIIGAFAGAVGAGGGSVISRALGKKDTEKAAAAAANTFLLYWMTAFLFSAAGLIFTEPLIRALGAGGVLEPYAKSYTQIILLGAVTATGFSSLIRAEGNIKFSIYQWTIPSLVNLLLDPLFIFVFDMGVKGAAWATVISQIVSACLSMYYFLFSKWHAYPIRLRHFCIKPDVMGEIMMIGSPTILSQLCNSVFLAAVNHRLGALGGADAISAFGIIGRLKAFLIMPVSGIVQGLQPIIGFNYAAGAISRVSKALKVSILAAVIYGGAAMAVCEIIPGPLLHIFIREETVVEIGITALRLMALSLPFMGR